MSSFRVTLKTSSAPSPTPLNASKSDARFARWPLKRPSRFDFYLLVSFEYFRRSLPLARPTAPVGVVVSADARRRRAASLAIIDLPTVDSLVGQRSHCRLGHSLKKFLPKKAEKKKKEKRKHHTRQSRRPPTCLKIDVASLRNGRHIKLRARK